MRRSVRKKIMGSLLLWGLASSLLFAQGLHLIPQPRKVVRGEGDFTLTPEKLLFITDADDTTLLFPANLFIREVKKDLGFEPEYTLEVKKASVLMGYRGWEKRFDKLTDPFVADLEQCGAEGYVLQVTPARILLVANSDTGLFYGAMTLNQLIRANRQGNTLPAVTIVDRPALRYRAWQDDISRGPIPTLAFLKEEVRRMASLKMNAFTLYTEHVFKLKSHPDIAPADGITAAQVRELSRYAEKYHVELIGNFQAFGHFGHILKLPAYRDLAETPNVISPAFEESYRLLEDILGEIARAYKSKLFIINCDEVFGLGTGPAKTMVDTMGLAGVYAYHINRLAKILKKYGKTPLMWGDIALKYPEIISQLPKDIIVLPWAYHAAPSFADQILPFRNDSLPYWVCPGVNCWSRIFPDLGTAEVNIAHFVRDGYRYGAEGMLNTTWDDDGENLFNYNWLPLGWGAEMAWKPLTGEDDSLMTVRYDAFVQAWDPLFYGRPAGVAQAMLRLDSLRHTPAAGNLTDHAFWKPMVDEMYDPQQTTRLLNSALDMEREAAAVLRAFEQARREVTLNAATIGYLEFAARRVLFLARKNILSYRINDSQERKMLPPDRLQRSLNGLIQSLEELKTEYARLWKEENRSYWLDHNLAKYDRLMQDIRQVPSHLFIIPGGDPLAHERMVTITPLFPAGVIRYTLDGTDPDTSSFIYEKPFSIDTTTTVKARITGTGKLSPVYEKKIFVYRGPVRKITLGHPYSERYTGGGPVGLVDGRYGTKNFRDGRWMGFEGDDLVAVLELAQPQTVDTLAARFLQQSRSWILFPRYVEFAVSEDGETWDTLCRVENEVPGRTTGTLIRTFTCPAGRKGVRYVRVSAKNTGTLPAWHPAAGGKAWIFTDEIEIR